MDVICGLIGAGKSTYAARNYETIYECENCCKEIQIEKARNNGNKKAAYVTCYPTSSEMDFFRTLKDVHFIWINTTEERAEKTFGSGKEKETLKT